jgi:hypothetical protein
MCDHAGQDPDGLKLSVTGSFQAAVFLLYCHQKGKKLQDGLRFAWGKNNRRT